ncbi:MAG: hypothetical protein Q7T71_20945 [Herbiconiux sp.]|nr:hypothetical protein [Herbiconiux sp.]
MQNPPPPFRPESVAGYRLGEQLAAGSRSVVYRALGSRAGPRHVVVKLRPPPGVAVPGDERSAAAGGLSAWRREARILAEGPIAAMPRLLQLGETAEGVPFIVMTECGRRPLSSVLPVGHRSGSALGNSVASTLAVPPSQREEPMGIRHPVEVSDHQAQGEPPNGEQSEDRVCLESIAPMIEHLVALVAELHAAGVAHGAIDADSIVLAPDGTPALVGFGRARTVAERGFARARDADLSGLTILTERLTGCAVPDAGSLPGPAGVAAATSQERPRRAAVVVQSGETDPSQTGEAGSGSLAAAQGEWRPRGPMKALSERGPGAAQTGDAALLSREGGRRGSATATKEELESGEGESERDAGGTDGGAWDWKAGDEAPEGDDEEPGLVEVLDPAWAAVAEVGRALRRVVRGRVRAVVTERRRRVLVAAVAAVVAAVVVLSLLLPSGRGSDRRPVASGMTDAPPSTTAVSPPHSTSADNLETGTEPERRPHTGSPADGTHDGQVDGAHEVPIEGDPPEIDTDDPVEAARLLLERRAGCLATGDAACIDHLTEWGAPARLADREIVRSGGSTTDPLARISGLGLVQLLGGVAIVTGVVPDDDTATPDPGTAGEAADGGTEGAGEGSGGAGNATDAGGGTTKPVSLLLMRGETGWVLRSYAARRREDSTRCRGHPRTRPPRGGS